MSAPAQEVTLGDYFLGDTGLRRGRTKLCYTRNPHRRAVLLDREAEADERRSRLHVAVFGDDPEDYVDVIGPEQRLADSARLLRIVAQCERERGDGPWMDAGYAERLDDRTLRLQVAVDWLIDRFVAGEPRQPLLDAMCQVWGEYACSQSVETIATLPVGRSLLRGALQTVDDWRHAWAERKAGEAIGGSSAPPCGHKRSKRNPERAPRDGPRHPAAAEPGCGTGGRHAGRGGAGLEAIPVSRTPPPLTDPALAALDDMLGGCSR